jgi:hypothetical protein
VNAVNFGYLEGFLAGDKAVVLEVLDLFLQQGAGWNEALKSSNPDWRAAAHAIRGAAGGVGATRLADACQAAEFGGSGDLPLARAELARALAAIEAYLADARQSR